MVRADAFSVNAAAAIELELVTEFAVTLSAFVAVSDPPFDTDPALTCMSAADRLPELFSELAVTVSDPESECELPDATVTVAADMVVGPV